MKFGLFADIHSNLEALLAVLSDMAQEGVTQPVCVGDVVGYNANPSECLEIVRELGCPQVLGNHDEAATWEEDPANFNLYALRAIQYTKAALSVEQRQYLAKLPMTHHFDSFSVVHSEFGRPESWVYLLNAEEAYASMYQQHSPLAFFGHTHLPHMFVHDGHEIHEYFYRKFVVDPERKYFINVGSVGQPRDGDWRAKYVIFDTEEQTVELRRVAYDLALTQKKIIEAGLPKRLADRLAYSE